MGTIRAIACALLIAVLAASCGRNPVQPESQIPKPGARPLGAQLAAAGSGHAFAARLEQGRRATTLLWTEGPNVDQGAVAPWFACSDRSTFYVSTYQGGAHAYADSMTLLPGSDLEVRASLACSGVGYGLHVRDGQLVYGRWVFFDLLNLTWAGQPLPNGPGVYRKKNATLYVAEVSPDSATVRALRLVVGGKTYTVSESEYRP